MASIYKSTNLTESQQLFIKLMDEYEIDIFSANEIEGQLEQKFDHLNAVLINLVDKGFLLRLERGKYCKATFKDENVIGCHLVADGVIAYWSALNLHGLTEQFANTIFVQTTKLKSEKMILGVLYKFVQIRPTKQQGIELRGYGNHQFRITGLEKTIVDCFDRVEYSGGYAELIRAYAGAKIESDLLIAACKVVGNSSVIKRLGYLTELLKKQNLDEFIRFAKKYVKAKYSLFDPQGKDDGAFDAGWKLRLNISKTQLIDISNKQY